MKKSFIILPLVLTCGLVSCGSKETLEYSQEDMVLNFSTYNLDVSDKFTLHVDNEKLNRKLEWSSVDTSIASVSASGVVKGLSVGETTIHAKYKTLETSCLVKVLENYSVAFIDLDYSDVTLGIDGFVEVSAKTIYRGETIGKLDYTWTCEDTSVVSVTSYNNRASITAVGGGETNVFVTTSFNGETIMNMITVTVIEGLAYFEIDNLPFEDGAYTLKVKRNTTVDLNINVFIDGIQVVDPYFAYTVEDPTVATINGNKVTGLKLGSTTITANYKNLGTVTINVVVSVI